MIAKKLFIASAVALSLAAGLFPAADQRQAIFSLGVELDREAESLARESFDHFSGRDATISDEEQAVLFRSEAFLSACRLFVRLTEERSDYFRSGYLRTNLCNAFLNVRRAFRDLESLYRYNYDRKRGKDPCAYLVQVAPATLNKMPEGDMVDLSFDGRLIIELGNRPNRGVYLIENGKKRGLTSPQVLQRLGGWSKVFEVPVEIIEKYPEGEPIN
ncbi:MAG: hypothetical protein A2W03_04945 [Candidatus Aminicenantes bacterium RBG_16_63_16]|nr:MAG: hypothetical protein A2W03_04945 [Candidatus Aminicenantes bacterium RBG_16_63_16]